MPSLFVLDRKIILLLTQIKPKVLMILNFWYVGLFLCAGIGLYSGLTLSGLYPLWYELAKKAGELALIVFSVILVPGMARRFRIKIPFVSIITFFRRQLGITMFLFAFWHYATLRLASQLTVGISLSSTPLFELVGIMTFFLTAPLFFTSNNWSMKILGKWWKRLHRLVYLIVWLLFFHVALNSNAWMIVIGAVAAIELASLLYEWLVPPPLPPSPLPPTAVTAYAEPPLPVAAAL